MKKVICIIIFMVCFLSICVAQTLNVPAVDNTTYEGKVMFGYQGWFAHPDDESVRPNYWHWGDLSVVSTDNLNVEMYPDLSEYCYDEKYPTAYTFANNSIATVFSSGRLLNWVSRASAGAGCDSWLHAERERARASRVVNAFICILCGACRFRPDHTLGWKRESTHGERGF